MFMASNAVATNNHEIPDFFLAKTNNQPVSNFVLFEKTIETTTLVTLSLTLAACLVLGLGIGVKLYLEKVNR